MGENLYNCFSIKWGGQFKKTKRKKNPEYIGGIGFYNFQWSGMINNIWSLMLDIKVWLLLLPLLCNIML